MKSKLLLMTLALMSTLSSKCAYGMDSNKILQDNLNKLQKHFMINNMHDINLSMCQHDSALTLLLNENDINTHITEVMFNMINTYSKIDDTIAAQHIDHDISQYLRNAKDSGGYNFMQTMVAMLCTHADDISDAFKYASDNIVVLSGYLCAAVNGWQLYNGPERFANMLMHFLLKYQTLSDVHYQGVCILISECKRCGGKIDNKPRQWKDEAHQDPTSVLLQLIECIAQTNTIAQCRNILQNPQAVDEMSFKQIDDDGIISTQTHYTGALRQQLYVLEHHIKLGVLSDSSNCGYMAMGNTKNSLMDLLIESFRFTVNYSDHVKKMIAYEILALAKAGPDDEMSFFSNALAQLPGLIDQANEDEAFNLAVKFTPNYLQFLKNNDIKMRLIIDGNDQLSGVAAAIAYRCKKDLAIVDNSGQITHKYLGGFAETIYIVNKNGLFQKGVVIK